MRRLLMTIVLLIAVVIALARDFVSFLFTRDGLIVAVLLVIGYFLLTNLIGG